MVRERWWWSGRGGGEGEVVVRESDGQGEVVVVRERWW